MKSRNKEKRSAASRRYWANKPVEIRRAVTARKRAIRRGAVKAGSLTTQQWLEILAAFNGMCAYCSSPWEHLEHVIPISKGGTHSADNVVPACAPCNLRKYNKTLEEWISN